MMKRIMIKVQIMITTTIIIKILMTMIKLLKIMMMVMDRMDIKVRSDYP